MTEPFPLSWDDPTNADVPWVRQEMHFPTPVFLLQADALRNGWGGVAGANYVFVRLGSPVRAHWLVMNGFVYLGRRVNAPKSEWASIQKHLQEQLVVANRAQAKVTRQYWTETVVPKTLEGCRWMQETPIESAALPEIATTWNELWRRIPQLWELHGVITGAAYWTLENLADTYEEFVAKAPPGEALSLVAGLTTHTHQVQRDLHALSEDARSSPAVAALILRNPHTTLAALGHVEGGDKFLFMLREFLNTHGHLGGDFVVPSWADDPSQLLVEVQKRLEHPQDDPERMRQHLTETAAALAGQVHAALRGRPDDLTRFEDALALAREVGPLTEDHNYFLDRNLYAFVNRFIVRVGRRLTAADVLDHPGDIFHLRIREVAATLREPRDVRRLIDDRKTQYAAWALLHPPTQLGPVVPPQVSRVGNRFNPVVTFQQEGTVIRGIGASAGTAQGPARIILTPDGFGRVRPGDVLVCPSSNSSWVPLFGIIAALITDTGGVTSHAAVVAREFGVPAVVGTGGATRQLQDGQLIEVDGAVGIVRLLVGQSGTVHA